MSINRAPGSWKNEKEQYIWTERQTHRGHKWLPESFSLVRFWEKKVLSENAEKSSLASKPASYWNIEVQ